MAINPPDRTLYKLILPVLAALAGVGVAAGIATAPGATLDAAVDRVGIAALIPAAASPVGVTGRVAIALAVGLLVAAFGWVGRLLPARRVVAKEAATETPVVRRADAHPDAPPCRPIRASEDLGAPLPIVGEDEDMPPAERALPVDLDVPMSAFDPDAVPEEPLEPVRAVAPLVHRPAQIAPGERFETFPLTPPAPVARAEPTLSIVPPVPAPVDADDVSAPLHEATIADLLARLERGASKRREPVAREADVPSLDDTLQRLRRLAAG